MPILKKKRECRTLFYVIYLNSAVQADKVRTELEWSGSKVVLQYTDVWSDLWFLSPHLTHPICKGRNELFVSITYKQYRTVLHRVKALLSLYTLYAKSTTGNIYFNVLAFIGPEQTLFSSAKTFLYPVVTVMDFLISHIIRSVKTINI